VKFALSLRLLDRACTGRVILRAAVAARVAAVGAVVTPALTVETLVALGRFVSTGSAVLAALRLRDGFRLRTRHWHFALSLVGERRVSKAARFVLASAAKAAVGVQKVAGGDIRTRIRAIPLARRSRHLTAESVQSP